MTFDFIPVPPNLAARLGLPEGKFVPVTPEIRERVRKDGPSVEALVAGCEAYLEVDPADEDYRRFVARFHHHRGVVLANDGRVEEAYECLARARDLDPGAVQAQVDFARAAAELERAEPAIDGYSAALAAGEKSPEIYDGLARAFALKGDWKSAFAVAEESRREFPDSAAPLHTLSTLQYHSGDKAGLEKTLYDQLGREPGNPLTLEKLAVWFRECGRFQEALSALRRAEKLAPGHRRLSYQRGMVEFRSGDRVAAEKTFRALLASDPGNLDARAALGLLLTDSSSSPEAEAIFRKTTEEFPRDYRAWFHLGRLCARDADRAGEALGCFEKVVELGPRDRQAIKYIYVVASEAGADRLTRSAELRMRDLGDDPHAPPEAK